MYLYQDDMALYLHIDGLHSTNFVTSDGNSSVSQQGGVKTYAITTFKFFIRQFNITLQSICGNGPWCKCVCKRVYVWYDGLASQLNSLVLCPVLPG